MPLRKPAVSTGVERKSKRASGLAMSAADEQQDQKQQVCWLHHITLNARVSDGGGARAPEPANRRPPAAIWSNGWFGSQGCSSMFIVCCMSVSRQPEEDHEDDGNRNRNLKQPESLPEEQLPKDERGKNMSRTIHCLRFILLRLIVSSHFWFDPPLLPNAGTERCGRPSVSELATDVARPHSLQ